MTAIVGVVDADGNIFLGGDTAGTSKHGDQNLFLNKKVFAPVQAPEFAMGVCGSFRLMQVMKYHFAPPLPPGPTDDMEEYFATIFIHELIVTFKNAGLFEEWGEGVEGAAIVGYQGKLAIIQSNFQVVMPRTNFAALGSGDNTAYGALFATPTASPIERVFMALNAAAYYSSMVREPFDVHTLLFDPTWAASKPQRKKKSATAKK